jgi:hypothetical protein
METYLITSASVRVMRSHDIAVAIAQREHLEVIEEGTAEEGRA